jgi:predicted transcriptional regulator
MNKKINPVRKTSLLAFAHALETLGKRQLEVLKTVDKIEPCSDLDIAECLDKPINTITPRRNELVKKGLVFESHTGISKQTGRVVIFWKRNRF